MFIGTKQDAAKAVMNTCEAGESGDFVGKETFNPVTNGRRGGGGGRFGMNIIIGIWIIKTYVCVKPKGDVNNGCQRRVGIMGDSISRGLCGSSPLV